ncbi:histidine phosphatase family protein [Streptomyces sp. NPDC090052]|uniref:histidine phosphatase family protein n=1 Tax=unclassified Streptomyces TaxID=2593676 RepID=UPI00225AE353|nr:MULTISPECIES: histidine phosphatase family protein [unclassified Streptomyces]MCX4722675.1 histidine phosphatase family protein [Streptomyces sp. NBC_01306]WSV07682.1 histidine phosphatase family protein [Streptomyces sp. NBC_01020]WSX45773.1 histidine phosphatase family protein [Streptomyces sp. NBC_00963]WSX66154.1 histidine phosphatase family protein [Streptomyces sp. NBC_00932]
MTVRVMLISAAHSAALREARIDDEGPLDEAGARRAARAASAVPGAGRMLTAPDARCRETAAALGLRAEPEPSVRGWDLGRWRGSTLEDLTVREPDAVAAWLTDPSAAPHGGESLDALRERAGGWLEGLAGEGGRVLAVAGPAVVRAAVLHALALPAEAFWRLDAAPLTLTELSGRAGRWNLRIGRPLEQ